MKEYSLVIIGAGPAGLAAAVAARRRGLDGVLLLDRMDAPGGIPAQCFHTGFGRARYGYEMRGAEYAQRLTSELDGAAKLETGAFVLHLSEAGVMEIAGGGSVRKVAARAVILATGCRERPIGSLEVSGSRPAGVFTAGSVQRMINLGGYKVGGRAVVLGSGDVGMIVAHHLTECGTEVLAVLEKADRLGGLLRNKRNYLDPHGIPLIYESTVTRLVGSRRLEALEICRVDKSGKPVPDSEYRLECDTLVSSVGLIPELELIYELDAAVLAEGEAVRTKLPWLFVCGNARRVHSLVDTVEQDGEAAGLAAFEYLQSL